MSLVSLILPCHDLGRHLEEAVDSVFAQTHRELEILVVDDASTDAETRRLLERFDWPRTRVLRQAQRQPARALNAGLQAAAGTFVGVLDPRHVLEPRYVQSAVAALESDATLEVVTCRLREGKADGVPALQPEGLGLPGLLVSCSLGPAALARRETLLKHGGFDPAFSSALHAEWDLWLRLAAAGARSHVLPEPLVRLGPADDNGDAAQAEARRLIEKHQALYERHLSTVLAGKEALLRELSRRNEGIIQRLEAGFGELAQRRGEAETLRSRLASDGGARGSAVGAAPVPGWEERDRAAVLEEALTAARAEVEALRGSASWRLTAPLRAVHAWLTRGR